MSAGVEVNNIQWGNYHGMLVPLTAPHVDTGMDVATAKRLIRQEHAWMMRWVSDFDCKDPTQWWCVIKDGGISLDELSRNGRHDVRRGLDRCEVRKLDHRFIAENAYPVYSKTFSRYRTRSRMLTEEQFRNSILQNPRRDQADYWGVFEKTSGAFAGYCKNRVLDDSCEYITGQFDPDYLKYYSSLVLIYEMSRFYLNEKKLLYVSDGQRVISHDTNIQEFLIHKLHFRKAYCRLNVVYHPLVEAGVKALYPFRRLRILQGEPFSAVLFQEEVRRSFLSSR